jgi:hypothetical protein
MAERSLCHLARRRCAHTAPPAGPELRAHEGARARRPADVATRRRSAARRAAPRRACPSPSTTTRSTCGSPPRGSAGSPRETSGHPAEGARELQRRVRVGGLSPRAGPQALRIGVRLGAGVAGERALVGVALGDLLASGLGPDAPLVGDPGPRDDCGCRVVSSAASRERWALRILATRRLTERLRITPRHWRSSVQGSGASASSSGSMPPPILPMRRPYRGPVCSTCSR